MNLKSRCFYPVLGSLSGSVPNNTEVQNTFDSERLFQLLK